MDIVSLAAITVLCGVAAVFFFMQSSRLREEIDGLQSKASDAESDARKQSDRAESMRKKLEAARNAAAEQDQGTDKGHKRVNELKDEIKRQTTSLEKAAAEKKALERRTRKAERRAEELQAVVAGRGLKAPAETDEPAASAPVAGEPKAPVDAHAEQRALRRAELEAEKSERILEIERLRTQRELSQSERLAEEERAELAKLRDEREVMTERIMGTEQNLRIAQRKLEDNRRAYIVTAQKLALAGDELFRLRGKTDEVPETKPLPTPEELANELGAEQARSARKPAAKKKTAKKKKAAAKEPAAETEEAKESAAKTEDANEPAAKPARNTRKKATSAKPKATKATKTKDDKTPTADASEAAAPVEAPAKDDKNAVKSTVRRRKRAQ